MPPAGKASVKRRTVSGFSDVFVPDRRMRGDVVGQHPDTRGGDEIHDRDAALPQPVERSREVDRLADHDRADAKLPDEPAAIPAWRERRNQDLVAVASLPPGLAEGVGLSMNRGVGFLDSPVASAAQKLPGGIEERRSDRDASLGQSLAGFLDRYAKERFVVDGDIVRGYFANWGTPASDGSAYPSAVSWPPW